MCRVMIIDDSLFEKEEKFTVILSQPMGGRLGNFSKTVVSIIPDAKDGWYLGAIYAYLCSCLASAISHLYIFGVKWVAMSFISLAFSMKMFIQVIANTNLASFKIIICSVHRSEGNKLLFKLFPFSPF